MVDIEFNFEENTAKTDNISLLIWISMLHAALVNSGAWDRLVNYDTQTAQELTVLATMRDRL